MRTRGQKYWNWASVDLHVRNHDEKVDNRTLINVQVRNSPVAGTQLFVGAYDVKGAMLFEEVYDSRPGQTMTQAIEWGTDRAKTLIESHGTGPWSPTPAALPRKGSRSFKE